MKCLIIAALVAYATTLLLNWLLGELAFRASHENDASSLPRNYLSSYVVRGRQKHGLNLTPVYEYLMMKHKT